MGSLGISIGGSRKRCWRDPPFLHTPSRFPIHFHRKGPALKVDASLPTGKLGSATDYVTLLPPPPPPTGPNSFIFVYVLLMSEVGIPPMGSPSPNGKYWIRTCPTFPCTSPSSIVTIGLKDVPVLLGMCKNATVILIFFSD